MHLPFFKKEYGLIDYPSNYIMDWSCQQNKNLLTFLLSTMLEVIP